LNDPVSNLYTVGLNRFHFGMQVLEDGALIYTNGPAPGSVIQFNYVSESLGNSIYHDEGSFDITSTNNVITLAGTYKLHNTEQLTINGISTDTINSFELAGTNVDNTLTNPTADGAATAIANGEALNTGLEAAYESIRSREGSVAYSTAGVVLAPDLSEQGLENSDPVSSLIDKRYQVELTGSGVTRPAYLSAGINSQPALDFVASSSQVLGGSELLITQSASWTIIMVLKADITTDNRVAFYNGNPASNGMGLMILGGAWTVILGGAATCVSEPATTNPTLLVARYRFGGLSVRINGAPVAVTNDNVSPVTPTGGVTLGATTGANFFDGLIVPPVVANRGMDDVEIERIEAEMAAQYGITL
jgi:hypothetical protein